MYIYRVTAVNRSIYKVAESEPSNELTIIAPSVPQALTSFVVVPNTKNVELRWNNDNNVNSQIKIDYTAFDTNDYVNLATFPWTQSDYIYNSSYKGSKVTYRASQINAMGESSPKYDFIYPPYRNVAITSPIYIKEISFENWDIEQWPAGTAEFYLKIMGVNDSGQAIEILPQMTLNIERIEAVGGYLPKFQEFTNRLAHNWHYFSEKDWYSSLRFYVEEYDVSLLDAEFTANANINKKITDDLTVEAGVGLKVKFSDRGEQCGYADLNYFDNPENTLQFQNYGVKMVISERQ